MRRSEKGRSMVEMLGVLAIIGVLSVGGIYGYTIAMNKHKANEVAQYMSMLDVLAQSKDGGEGGIAVVATMTKSTSSGFVFVRCNNCLAALRHI